MRGRVDSALPLHYDDARANRHPIFIPIRYNTSAKYIPKQCLANSGLHLCQSSRWIRGLAFLNEAWLVHLILPATQMPERVSSCISGGKQLQVAVDTKETLRLRGNVCECIVIMRPLEGLLESRRH